MYYHRYRADVHRDMHSFAVEARGRSKSSFNLRCYRWRSSVTLTPILLPSPPSLPLPPIIYNLSNPSPRFILPAAWENASKVIRDTWFRIGSSAKNAIRSRVTRGSIVMVVEDTISRVSTRHVHRLGFLRIFREKM